MSEKPITGEHALAELAYNLAVLLDRDVLNTGPSGMVRERARVILKAYEDKHAASLASRD